MEESASPQVRMDAAFANYIALSKVLRDDLAALLKNEVDSQDWRRNFVRVCASLVEGYTHSLCDISELRSVSVSPEIGKLEAKAISSERGLAAIDRVKFTLRAAYKLFELQPLPDFGGSDWARARIMLDRRDLLMHPKKPSDLEIDDQLWAELRPGATWLIAQYFNFIEAQWTKYRQK